MEPTASLWVGRRHLVYLVLVSCWAIVFTFWVARPGFDQSARMLPWRGDPLEELLHASLSPNEASPTLPSPTFPSAYPRKPKDTTFSLAQPSPSLATPLTYPMQTFPPSSALYANLFSVYPATDAIYPNQMVSDSHPRLRHLLSVWTYLAASLDLRYVTVFGSLLGCLRNGKIIPWDKDMDVAIDRDTAVLLGYLALTSAPRFTLNGITIELNSAVADHQPWKNGETRLIVNQHRVRNKPGYGPRYNRKGEVVDSHEDSVSFAGPFARLVSYVEGDGTTHMDVFCVEEFNGHYGEEATEVGPERASFPKKVEACELEGYQVWCPSKEDYEPVLVDNYGEDYLYPPQKRLQENSAVQAMK
jgi:hypothetical protein